MLTKRLIALLVVLLAAAACTTGSRADDWPRWRGPQGNAVADGARLPTEWDARRNVVWSIELPGEGSSSPIVWGGRMYLTSSLEGGARRRTHCFELQTGESLWTREIEDDDPEVTSALTGHAAPTPATDGRHVVAFFGNAGVVCYDVEGKQIWRRRFDTFVSELGLASSPVLHKDRVILVCDHDGNRFKTFDSFLIALDLKTGETVWQTDRRGLYRSWSTPILVPAPDDKLELIVNAQDELRGYDPDTGKQLWTVEGMTGWVTPSPVFGDALVFATSGKDGPTMAVRPGGRGDVTATHVVWSHRKGAPYVCSPLLYGGLLYVHNEQGILTCYEAASGRAVYRQRLEGKFTASGIASDGKVYLTNDEGATFVIAAGREYRLLAKNDLEEECLASPAVAPGVLLLRTEHRVYCVGEQRTETRDEG